MTEAGKVVDHLGLRTVQYPGALGQDAVAELDRPGTHVIEVEREGADAGLLEAHGFVLRPTEVLWITRPRSDDMVYLHESQSSEQRRKCRRALASFERSNLRKVHHGELDAAVATQWIELYHSTISGMTYGDVGVTDSAELVGRGYELLAVHDEHDQMVAGSIVAADEMRDFFVGIMRGIAPAARRHDLPRVMDLWLVDEARRRGLSWASLGSDPNIYGHVAKAGLARYKRSLGFHPVATDTFLDGWSRDVWTAFLRTDGLVPPVMTFAYTGARDEAEMGELRPVVLVSHGEQPDVGGLGPVEQRTVGTVRRAGAAPPEDR